MGYNGRITEELYTTRRSFVRYLTRSYGKNSYKLCSQMDHKTQRSTDQGVAWFHHVSKPHHSG